MSREVLDADLTLYVRSDALYSDAPGRLDSAAGACKTWAQAIELVKTLDFAGHTVTIRHGSEGAHTFTDNVFVPTLVGGGQLLFRGQATPGNTFFNVVGADCFTLYDTRCQINFQDMKLQNSGGGSGLIQVAYQSLLVVNSGVIFGSAANAHIWVHDSQALALLLSTSYSIVGGGAFHVFCNMGKCFMEANTVTLSGTPAFSGAFIGAQKCAAVQIRSNTFNGFAAAPVGAATGSRYNAALNGVIDTGTGNATLLPGNAAGSTASGGVYA